MSDLIDKIHQQVQDFQGQEFVAPYLGDNKIRIRLNGLVLTLRVSGVLDPYSLNKLLIWITGDGVLAEPLGLSTHIMVREYLELFPEVRLLITREDHSRFHGTLYGIMSRSNTGRVQFQGEVPIVNLYDVYDCMLFDEVTAHFDGQIFFLDQTLIDNPGDMMVAAKLREEIQDRQFTYDNRASLAAKYMRPEHELAFRLAWDRLMLDAETMVEQILGKAVSHAGGRLKSYKKDADTYQVRMEVDHREYKNVVISKDLEVISSGICLSGHDRIFDLQSLVSVFREGQSDYDDDDY